MVDEFGYGDNTLERNQRVQLCPSTDRWMRGDMFGCIVGFARKKRNDAGDIVYRVHMDRSGATIRVPSTRLKKAR